jgi:hypothetical protein
MTDAVKLALIVAGGLAITACQTNAGRGAAMGAATGGSVVGGAALGAAGGAVLGGPADSAMAGGARGAALGSATGGSAVTGAVVGGTAGAIRGNNANEPAGQPVPTPPQTRFEYNCDNGESVAVRFFPQQGVAVLERGGQNVELTQQSGTSTFSNGQTTVKAGPDRTTIQLQVGMMATTKCGGRQVS